MRIKKIILSAILGAVATTSCFAQSSVNNDPRDAQAQQQGYYSQPYAFVQAQGGFNTILCPGRKVNPTFSIAGGYMFTPAVGLRMHVNGIKVKNGFHSTADMYKFNYLNTNFDLMVNLTNLGKQPAGALNVYLVAGAGLDTHKDLLSHNIRAGLLVDYNICKELSVGAEIDLNNLSDRFDSRYNDGTDWMATGQISITYKFGYKAYGSDRVFPTMKAEKKKKK